MSISYNRINFAQLSVVIFLLRTKTQLKVASKSACRDEFVSYGDCCVEHKEDEVSLLAR